MFKDSREKGGILYRGKSTAKQCTAKRAGRHSKRGGQLKGSQENFPDAKRSMVEYWNRKVGYT